jgi:hypothetical protein
MQTSLSEIETAIEEAEIVRSRHDGVHVLHGYVTILHFCRYVLMNGDWSPVNAVRFRQTMVNLRCVDRTGFPPRRGLELIVE